MKPIKLSKSMINVIDNVSLPFAKELLNSENGRKYFDTKEKQFQFILDIVKLSMKILRHPALYFEVNQTNEEIYDDMREFLNECFYTAIKAMQKKEEIKNNLNEEEEAVIKKVEEIEEDEFFDFDSEVTDDFTNKMHYSDEEKFSAEEFLENNEFDMDLVYDLEDYIDRYFSLKEIDEAYIEDVKEILYKFIAIFEMSVEFKNLSMAFIELLDFVSKIKFDNKNINMIKMFIDTIMEDLEKWLEHIFIKKDANDIHYLDASLYASIQQLSLIIRGVESGNTHIKTN